MCVLGFLAFLLSRFYWFYSLPLLSWRCLGLLYSALIFPSWFYVWAVLFVLLPPLCVVYSCFVFLFSSWCPWLSLLSCHVCCCLLYLCCLFSLYVCCYFLDVVGLLVVLSVVVGVFLLFSFCLRFCLCVTFMSRFLWWFFFCCCLRLLYLMFVCVIGLVCFMFTYFPIVFVCVVCLLSWLCLFYF